MKVDKNGKTFSAGRPEIVCQFLKSLFMQNVQIKISNGLTERVRDRWIPDLGLGSFKERVEAKEHLLNDLVETFSLTLSPSERMFIVLQSKLNNVIFSENDSD